MPDARGAQVSTATVGAPSGAGATHHALRRSAATPPTREQIATSPRVRLRSGGPGKADVFVVRTPTGETVVKDFAGKGPLTRLVGRLQIRREARAYRRLDGLAGFPRFLGRIDPWALALERVAGEPIHDSPERARDGERLLARLRDVVERMHADGLVHWDLRARDNVLFGRDSEVWVVDLASAVWLQPGSVLHRLCFAWMRLVDDSAMLKWKEMLSAGPFTASEREFLRRFERWRALWIFNRKRRTSPPG